MLKSETEAARLTPAAAHKDRFLAVLLVIAIVELWLLPLKGSFWLDETATYWIIKDGLRETIHRSISWSGQSPLYYLIARAALAAGGPHEILLRMPSVIAMATAAYLLYRLAIRLFDAETAPLTVVVFVSLDQIAFAAADARPYAVGLCMLAGSALMLVRWLDSGRIVDAAGYALFTALTVYSHYLLALGLVAPGIYGLYWILTKKRERLVGLLAIFVVVGILLTPLVPQFLTFYRSRTSHSFSYAPQFGDLLLAITPPILAVSIAFGFLLAWLFVPDLKGNGTLRRDTLLMLTAWVLVPPVFCYLISVFTETKLFLPRYYSSSAPAIALVAGWVMRRFTAGAARRIIAAAVVLAAVMSFGTLTHGDEDWPGAMRAVRSAAENPEMPVLIPSGFVEGADPKALDDPRLREVLFAPLLLYPAAGDEIRLPYRLDNQSEPYLENVIVSRLQNVRAFVFVGLAQGLTFEPWLRGRLATAGFESRSLGGFGKIQVFLFKHRGGK